MKTLKKENKLAIEILLNYDDVKIGCKNNKTTITKFKKDFQDGLKYLIENFSDGRDVFIGNIFNIDYFTSGESFGVKNKMTLRNLRSRFKSRNKLKPFQYLTKLK